MDASTLRRRPVVIAASVVVVVAVATVAAVVLTARDSGGGHHDAGLPSATPTGELTIDRVRVGAYGDSMGHSVALLDPRTRSYRRYPGSGAISPDGRRAVLWGGDPASALNPGAVSVTVLDLTTGHRRAVAVPHPAQSFAWSRDGARIVGTVVGANEGATENGTRLGFVLVGADTGTASFVPVGQDSCASEDLGDFAWSADGTEVFAMTGGAQQPFRPCSITYFGLDGTPHRTLDGAGNVFGGPLQELSPDGTRMFVLQRKDLDADADGEQVVIDTATGARAGRLGAGVHAPFPVGWVDTTHLLAAVACDRNSARLAVIDLAGHPTRTVTRCARTQALLPQLIPAPR